MSHEFLCVAVVAADSTAFEKQLAAACATALVDLLNAREVAIPILEAVMVTWTGPAAQAELPAAIVRPIWLMMILA